MNRTFDQAELLERVGDDRDLLSQLFELYQPRSVELIGELQTLATSPDAQAIARTAHQLRGMLANMSGHRACALAAELEEQGKQAALQRLPEKVQTLAVAVQELTGELSAFVRAN